jgi:glycine cleavage system H protein
VKAGEACAVVESVKAASDVYAPLDGEIVAANEALASAPEQVNADAWNAWLFRMKPSDPSAAAKLLDADGYRDSVGEG